MYSTIFFDLDGTLTDPGVGITNSVAYALKKWDIEVSERSLLYPFIGPPLSDSFQRYFGFSKEDSMKAIEYYREYFRDRGIFENEVYDGVHEMLTALRSEGKTIVLATSKPEGFAKTILEHFDLAKYFDFVAGASMDESRSKKGQVIAYALESLRITDKSTVVMVGDREHDVMGAKENSLDCIGVLFGYGSREELETAGATYVAEQVGDILRFI
ncbi:MAG: HAD family hydrolase [Lachnospiraceae bacterium]|nr:HAD family hydrolase [Lachnospiraceae bacterium]